MAGNVPKNSKHSKVVATSTQKVVAIPAGVVSNNSFMLYFLGCLQETFIVFSQIFGQGLEDCRREAVFQRETLLKAFSDSLRSQVIQLIHVSEDRLKIVNKAISQFFERFERGVWEIFRIVDSSILLHNLLNLSPIMNSIKDFMIIFSSQALFCV